MPKSKLFPSSSVIVTLAALFLVLLATPNDAETPREGLALAAHRERGNRVARRYQAYSKQLGDYHSSLIRALKQTAPEMLGHLQPREPILHGYQVLPRILPDHRAPEKRAPLGAAYSWPWTDHLIDEEQRKILRSQSELAAALESTEEKARAALQSLALAYDNFSRQHRIIDAHIQYNRLWQSAIAANRRHYDRESTLHDHIFEHQKIVERLARTQAAFNRAKFAYGGPDRLAEMTTGLRGREAQLRRRIDEGLNAVNLPEFLEIHESGAEWSVRVPLFTDIEDGAFLAATKNIIERTWRVDEGKKIYRVELDITFLSSDSLYRKGRPANGQKIDIHAHLGRFPRGAAILTTGASTTHVLGNAIVLGPHDLAPKILAHEFGHILGFRDLYVRAYKDLAEDGFQVMEIVADPSDIMAATPQGKVLPSHFLRLIQRATGEPLSPTMASDRPPAAS